MASFKAAPGANDTPKNNEANVPMKWAQRKDCIYLTIKLADVKEEKINLTESTLSFSGKSGDGRSWSAEFELFKAVTPDESKWNVTSRSIAIYLAKTEKEEEFWPRLLKDKSVDKACVTLDWDRYVDEDEEDEAPEQDTSQFDQGQGFGGGGMPGMEGMGGMGGMGGMPGMGGGGGGGMPGMEGMDMAKLQEMMKNMPGGMEGAMAGMGGMGGEGGAPGMPGGGGDSDDDDDLPDLEADNVD